MKQTTLFQLSGKSPIVLKFPEKAGGSNMDGLRIAQLASAEMRKRSNPLPNMKRSKLIEM